MPGEGGGNSSGGISRSSMRGAGIEPMIGALGSGRVCANMGDSESEPENTALPSVTARLMAIGRLLRMPEWTRCGSPSVEWRVFLSFILVPDVKIFVEGTDDR